MPYSDKMATRFAELPRLLAKQPYTQKELTEHFDVDRKTIKSAIDALTRPCKITENAKAENEKNYERVVELRLSRTVYQARGRSEAKKFFGREGRTGMISRCRK